MMQFKGKLLLPDEPGPGLSVNLDVAAHHLAVESDGGGLGAWPLEVVDVERLDGDVFALTVAGEPLRFVADDTIAFAYSGVPTIERVTSRTRSRSALRSIFDRIWNGPDESSSSVGVRSASSQASNVDGSGDEDLPPTREEEAPPVPMVGDGMPPVVVEDDLVPVPGEGVPLAVEDDLVPPKTEERLPPAMEEDHPSPVETMSTSVFEKEAGIPLIDVADRGGNAFDPGPVDEPDRPLLDDDLASAPGCPAIRGDGRGCESPILTSSGYCYPHDPKRAFEDRYQAAQQAREQLKRDSTARLNRIYGRLDKAMRQVERGELDPETAMAMAQLARTMCAILDVDEPPPGDR